MLTITKKTNMAAPTQLLHCKTHINKTYWIKINEEQVASKPNGDTDDNEPTAMITGNPTQEGARPKTLLMLLPAIYIYLFQESLN